VKSGRQVDISRIILVYKLLLQPAMLGLGLVFRAKLFGLESKGHGLGLGLTTKGLGLVLALPGLGLGRGLVPCGLVNVTVVYQ